MKSLALASIFLVVNMVACGLMTFTQNTGLLLVGFVTFIGLLWWHGFSFGRADVRVNISSGTGSSAPVPRPESPSITPAQRQLRRLSK